MMPVHQFPESDSKTNPLALLVQICSNIGAEKPTTKNSSSDKNGNSSSNNSNSNGSSSSEEIRVTKDKDVLSCSPANSVHSASSLTSSNRTSRGDDAPGFNSNSSKRNTPSECRSSPLLGRSSVERRTTPGSVHSPDGSIHHRPKSGGEKTPTSSATTSSSHESHQSSVTSSAGAGGSSSSDPTYSSSSLGLDFSRDTGLLGKDGGSSSSLSGLGSYKAGLNGLNPLALANCSGCSPVAGHIPLDATAAATYPLAGALKGAAGYSFGSALSPYMNYARMKSAAAGGAAAFVPVCRDPYCTNCQLAAQLPYQDRLAAHMSGLYPGGLPGYPVPGFASPGSSAFASSVIPRPNVCSWMAGGTFCGKQFASSDELFQHLRTHTNISGASGSLPLYSSGVSLPSALAMDACGLYTTPSLTTPAGLRRTYPTSLSPVSSLSAASRYHPYKPPGLSPLSSAPLPPLGHPGLGFYNPYSGVYGKG
ncbi:zinc finger protein Noc isoform X2 [Parasteatoda tepidariorum]|uniref:zinc finger protein Noc isoform X2 n=1 Tax=Parasteatoda tepidariorum TaxID=114398 RepID=UPI00077F81E1|nr:zinc finger protein Noc isoform X1 [Parasteatoda tepidariorum]